MDWRSFIQELSAKSGRRISLRHPGPRGELERIQREFAASLPNDYRELMMQSDGLLDENGCAILDSLERVLDMNRRVRDASHACYMPLDSLFFISSVYGNGDLVGYGLRRDQYEQPALYRWDHEDDSRTMEAQSLTFWLERMFPAR